MDDKATKTGLEVETIGDRLRKLRIEKGLNQTEFAHLLGFSANTMICRLENNGAYPTVETLLNLAKMPGVNLHHLLTGENAPAANAGASRLTLHVLNSVCQLENKIFTWTKALIRFKAKTTQMESDKKLIERLESQLDFNIRLLTTMWNDLRDAGRVTK